MATPGNAPSSKPSYIPGNSEAQAKKEIEKSRLQADCEGAKTKSKNNSKACRLFAQKEQEDLKDIGKNKFEHIASPERLKDARSAINWALNELKKPVYSKILKNFGITLESTDYYLAIATKESGLNQLEVSKSDAKGLFQVKTGTGYALDDIKNIFGLTIDPSQIFYIPKEVKNRKEEIRENKYFKTAAANNAFTGILYWHICKDVFRQRQNLQIPKEDQDRAACFSYKLGNGDFTNLWQSIEAKNFNDFAVKLSTQLAQKFPQNFILPKGGKDVLQDDTYKLNYTAYIYTGKSLGGAMIRIGKRNYDAANLVQTLRYSEIIQSLARKQPAAYEVANEHYQLWSIADKLLTRCGYSYGINYCQKNAISSNRKIPVLIDIIKEYNIKLKNPDFKDFIDEDESEELEDGAKVFLPPKEYIEQAIKKSQEDVKEEKEIVKPGVVPMYAGSNAAKMEAWGNKLIAPPKTPPKFVPGKDAVTHEDLHPEDPTIYGRMPKEQTKGIVIHSTEARVPNNLRHQDGYIHFILNRNGVIEVIHNIDIVSNHAGSSRWEGVKGVAHHTVGIEVINIGMPSLIRDGKINVALDKKAKVFSVKIYNKKNKKWENRYLTSTPPSKKALDDGFKQARQERGFTEEQYRSLKDLIAYIGSQKGLRYKDVVTHSMVATANSSRGRKSDPPVLYWEKLGLPNNHYRVDPDVATGNVKANIEESEAIRTGKKMTMVKYKGKLYYEILQSKIGYKDAYSYFPEARFGGTESMTVGLKAAEKIRQERSKKNKKTK